MSSLSINFSLSYLISATFIYAYTQQKASQLTSRLDDTAWLEQQAEKKKQAEAEAKAKLAAQTVNQGLQQGSVGLVQESQPMVKAEESMANSHQRDQSRDKMRNVILSKYTSENSKKAQGGDDALLSSKVKVESSQQGGAASSSSSTTVANTEHTMATKIGKRTFDDDDVEVPKPKVENKDLISEEEWNSSLQQSRKYYTLPNFNMENQNTVQLTVRVPPKSQAWSLNLSPTEDFFGTDILFHYNPRYNKRQIVLNDRQGTWGDFTLRDMDNRPTRDCVIRIYITDHGFYLYTDSRFEIFFRHRRDITEYLGQDLKLWFTYRDDNGNPHSIILKKVLWQHTDMNLFLSGRSEKVLSIVNDLMSAPLSESVANPMKPRTILMRGLPILSDLKILQGIEYSFFQSMKEFEPSSIALVPETQYAFIRVSHRHIFILIRILPNLNLFPYSSHEPVQ